MRWQELLGLAATVGLLTSCAAPMATTPNGAGRYDRFSGFSGNWQIDANQSDRAGGWNQERDRDGNYRNDADRSDGGNGWRLPDAIHIDNDRQSLRIIDADGQVVEQVATRGGRRRDDATQNYPGGYAGGSTGMVSTTGHWTGNRQLQIDATTVGDRTVSQTLSLDARDRLILVTSVSGDRGARTITSVYTRS